MPANSAGRAAIAQLCGKIQNAVSSSDFEIFSPEIRALKVDNLYANNRQMLGFSNSRTAVRLSTVAVSTETNFQSCFLSRNYELYLWGFSKDLF